MPDCWQQDGGVPPRGCLFKADSGEQLRQGLDHEARTYLDFSQSGSYRVKAVLDLYDWILPIVEDPADAIVMLHDWYACHKDPRVLELLVAKGHVADALLAGGLTLYGQPADVGLHADLAREYRDLELAETLDYRTRTGAKLAPADKQTVLSRGERAYGKCNYTRMPLLLNTWGSRVLSWGQTTTSSRKTCCQHGHGTTCQRSASN